MDKDLSIVQVFYINEDELMKNREANASVAVVTSAADSLCKLNRNRQNYNLIQKYKECE